MHLFKHMAQGLPRCLRVCFKTSQTPINPDAKFENFYYLKDGVLLSKDRSGSKGLESSYSISLLQRWEKAATGFVRISRV